MYGFPLPVLLTGPFFSPRGLVFEEVWAEGSMFVCFVVIPFGAGYAIARMQFYVGEGVLTTRAFLFYESFLLTKQPGS